VKDHDLLIRAFNETRSGNYEFNVAVAIEWILNLDQSKLFGHESVETKKVRENVNFARR
jgi:hypothetical protein